MTFVVTWHSSNKFGSALATSKVQVANIWIERKRGGGFICINGPMGG